MNKFFGKSKCISLEFLRYTCAGGIAFAIDFVVLWILTHFFNVFYLLSASFSFILGLIIVYLLSVKWVFLQRNILRIEMEFILFCLIGVVGLILNVLIMWIFTDKLSIHYLVSRIISAVIVFLYNFLARKILLF